MALIHKILTEIQFSNRTEALRNKTMKAKEVLPLAYEPLAYNSTAA